MESAMSSEQEDDLPPMAELVEERPTRCHYAQTGVCAKEAAFAVLATTVAAVKADTAAILKSINGNGEPGFKTRIDRLEQSHLLQRKIMWAVGSPVLGFMGILVWKLLTSKAP
jgi:hypothetical protein